MPQLWLLAPNQSYTLGSEGEVGARIIERMEFTCIPDVELVSVGMEWPSANGPLTFTFEHLRDAMVAANEDPHIVPPRLKIGHSDPRFADENDPGHDPFYDGEPALGSVTNLRLVNAGATLIGDYVEVPAWLAEMMPTAYPSRSIEGAWEIVEGAAGDARGTWDVVTPAGKKYSFVLTACALLGLCRPAVEDLEDLQRFLVEGKGVVVAGTAPEGGQPVAATMRDVPKAKDQPAPDARASIDSVINAFYEEHEEAPDSMYWWWVRDAWTDPNFLVVDDDEGGLWEVPFTSDDNQQVSFEEPTKVLQVFKPAPAEAAAMTLRNGRPERHFKSPEATRPDNRVRGGQTGSAQICAMDFTDEQRGRLAAKLGLETEATEEEILEALEAEEETTEETEGKETSESTESTETSTPKVTLSVDGKKLAEANAAKEDSPTVTLDRAAYEELKRNGELGAQAHAKQVKAHRKSVLDAAVASGKIMPSSRAAWEKKLEAAPEATEEEIGALETGLVPVVEEGSSLHTTTDGGSASDEDLAAAYIASNFPHLVEQEAA